MKKLFILMLSGMFSLGASAQHKLPNTLTPEQKLNNEYCTGLFQDADGTIIDVASNASAGSYFNILDWLDGRVSGLKVYKTKTGIRVPMIRDQQAAIYVDEVLVNTSYLNSLPSSEVAMIKVIKNSFSSLNTSGAIAIYTFRADADEEK
jgi:hypothetical protein